MSEKHTPGPWHIKPGDSEWETDIVYGDWCIATAHDGVDCENNVEANARLIAAAPDLLAALRAYQSAGLGCSTDIAKQCVAYDMAVEAIARAEGREVTR